MEFSRVRLYISNERQENFRWLSCAHMLRLRTLFTLIEDHRNVSTSSVLLSFSILPAQMHEHAHTERISSTSNTYKYMSLEWAELATHYHAMGVYQKEEKNRDVTRHTSNQIRECLS